MFVVPKALGYPRANALPCPTHHVLSCQRHQSSLRQVLLLSLAPGFWAGGQDTAQLEVRVNPGSTKPRSPRPHVPTATSGSLTIGGVGDCCQSSSVGVHFQLHLCPGNAEHTDSAITVPCHHVLALDGTRPKPNGTRLPGQALAALQGNWQRAGDPGDTSLCQEEGIDVPQTLTWLSTWNCTTSSVLPRAQILTLPSSPHVAQ